MKTYRIIIEMTTPYNPNKWDWDELIASEPGEEIIGFGCDEIDPDEADITIDFGATA